jgi:hypothetical protein
MPEEFLEPKEAASRFSDDPDSIKISLLDVMRAFKLSPGELRAELFSGRLKAIGTPNSSDFGFDNVGVSGGALLNWMITTGRRPPKVN